MENNLKKEKNDIKRGQVWYVNLENGVGSEQSGRRPCLIIQNNTGNRFSPTVVVAVLTTKLDKHNLPTHALLSEQSGLPKRSIVLLEQLKTIDKRRIKQYITSLTRNDLLKVDRALMVSLGLK